MHLAISNYTVHFKDTTLHYIKTQTNSLITTVKFEFLNLYRTY